MVSSFSYLGCIVLILINPLGPVHVVFTVTETSTTGLTFIVQVSIMLDPTDLIGLDSLLVTVTIAREGESGTIKNAQGHSLMS